LTDAGYTPVASSEAFTVADRWGTPLRIVAEDSSPSEPKETTS
jgi:hypothetical protein